MRVFNDQEGGKRSNKTVRGQRGQMVVVMVVGGGVSTAGKALAPNGINT